MCDVMKQKTRQKFTAKISKRCTKPKISTESTQKLISELAVEGMSFQISISTKKRFWFRGLVKSRQKNWRESRSRETEVGEKIAVTTS